MDVPLSLALVLALVAANGFFVATEFALVAVRRTRIEQLAATGSAPARSVLDALNHLDSYIAATQLGITMASLALGWIGEPAIGGLVEPLVYGIPFLPAEARETASHAASAAVAFVVITALHIVLGELAPKSIALQRAEATALAVARPIHLFLALFRLPIFLLNNLGNSVVRLVGIQPAAGHALVQSAEELKLAINASRQAGLVSAEEQAAVGRALDFGAWTARHVMVQRTEIIALPLQVTMPDIVRIMSKGQHTRYPVYDGTVDNIVGIVSAKRLVAVVAVGPGTDFDVRQHMTEPVFVPESVRAHVLLALMRKHRSHIAVAVDEYGVTAGLVTLRDVIARLAGDLPDESEEPEAQLEWLADGTALVEGRTLLSDLETQLGTPFGDVDFDTVGGLIFGRLGRRPVTGDAVHLGDYTFVVAELDGLRITRVRIRQRPPDDIPAVFLQDTPRNAP